MSDDRDAELVADENERTNEVGLFHYAISYRRAADALGTIKFKTTHPEAPRSQLYFHAIELYLKAFLRNAGRTVRQLKALGHNAGKLRDAYLECGGDLDDEDREVLVLMEQTDAVNRSRYIVTGAFRSPGNEALARTAKSLHHFVRAALKNAGKPVR